ncbi:hypothetical protein SLNWT_1160 [Streptomyces albus]|uniref:Uncharacterized protein n=1 Tax=Streptomyces albus (strain ATCC 21838 / DSM 41398 / FERM P-419 / JCM 4703 / NBRC 107858) TaxID=1081613 RepID=A0A0B5ES01_STRA4|nr:hypothetical protein SLNWT_1160 [Streptomyces albus]AOU75851.1 hypothetical protein SLNHY_1160 [Streptomyces albus]AYN31657.1 hypothetical protein DUI70_1154 [Streptomyces albus]
MPAFTGARLLDETKPPVQSGSEKKRWITQQGIVEGAAGGAVPAHPTIVILSTVPDPVDPGDVTFTLTAPTGFVFTGWITWTYQVVTTTAAKSNPQNTPGSLDAPAPAPAPAGTPLADHIEEFLSRASPRTPESGRLGWPCGEDGGKRTLHSGAEPAHPGGPADVFPRERKCARPLPRRNRPSSIQPGPTSWQATALGGLFRDI